MRKLISLASILLALTVTAQERDEDETPPLAVLIQKVMRSAVAHDYKLKQLAAEIEIAKRNVINEKGDFLPTATYTGTADEDNAFVSHSLLLNWNLFQGFGPTLDVKAAQADLEVQKLELLNADRRLRVEIGKKYLDLIDLFIQTDIQQQEVDLRKSSLETMKQRYKRGLVPESEVLKMNVDFLNSQIALQQVRERIKNEQEDFAKIVLYPIDATKFPAIPAPNINQKLTAPPYIEQFLSFSPLKKIDEWRLEASRLRRQRASYQVLTPTLDAFYLYDNNSGVGIGGDSYRYDSTVGLTLTWPLLNNLDDHSQYRVTQARELQAQYRLENTRRELLVQVQQIVNTLQTLQETIALQTENEELATRFYSQSLNRFRLGLINTNDMSLDQQRLTEARLRLSQLKKDYYKAVLDLNLLTGREIDISI